MNLNTIALQKGLTSITPGTENNLELVASIQAKLMTCGYMLDVFTFGQLRTSKYSDVTNYYNDIEDHLMSINSSKFTILSTTQVTDLVTEMALHAALGRFNEGSKYEGKEFKLIRAATEKHIHEIFTNLLLSEAILSNDDLEVIKWFINSGIRLFYPEQMGNVENMVNLAKMQVKVKINHPLDVMIMAIGMSGGDVSKSISENRDVLFKKFTRSERKYLIAMLESTSPDPRAMSNITGKWIRLGEVLHPGEFKKKYPQSAFCFLALRRGPKGTRTSKVHSQDWHINEAFQMGLAQGLNILVKLPAEFMKRLDWIIRNCSNIVEVAETVNKWKIAAPYTDNKKLYELYNHFDKRDEVNQRSVIVNGKKTKLPTLAVIDRTDIDVVLGGIKDALKYKFSHLPELGKVWIDPELDDIFLPNSTSFTAYTLLKLHAEARGEIVPETEAVVKFIAADFTGNKIEEYI